MLVPRPSSAGSEHTRSRRLRLWRESLGMALMENTRTLFVGLHPQQAAVFDRSAYLPLSKFEKSYFPAKVCAERAKSSCAAGAGCREEAGDNKLLLSLFPSCRRRQEVVLLVLTFTQFGFLELLLSCGLQKMNAGDFRMHCDLMGENKTASGTVKFTAACHRPLIRLTPFYVEDKREYKFHVGLSPRQLDDLHRSEKVFPFLEAGPRCGCKCT